MMPRRFVFCLISIQLLTGCTDGNEMCKASVIGGRWACPPPWIEWGGKCYRAIMDDLNWLEAKEMCIEMGGFLVAPRSQEETQFILRLLPYSIWFWINCNDLDEEGTWKCQDGTDEVEFRNWAAKEPNDYNGNEDCAQVYTSRTWNDIPCDFKRPAICKAATSLRCTF